MGNAKAHSAVATESPGFDPIPLTSLRIDSVTNFDLYFQSRPDQPFVLYAERNQRFTESIRQRLLDHSISTIFVRQDQRKAYSRYVEQNLSEIIGDNTLPVEEKSEILYSSACEVVETILANPESVDEIRRSREMAKHTVGFMLADRKIFSCLLQAISTVYKVYSHSVNVVTYSVALAQRLGHKNPATLRELAVGALLHDIGKSKIDASIMNHSGVLTKEQWEVMKKHPKHGYEILNKTGSVGNVPLDIVLHHHEKLQGKGYPDGLSGSEISEFVRIVAITDSFDALTTDRPYQKARSSFAALSLMNAQLASDLDREYFRAFVSLMGHPDGE